MAVDNRTAVGCVLAVAGVAAVGSGVWQPWYAGVEGRDLSLTFLFGADRQAADGLFGSLFIPALVTTVLVALALALRTRALMVLAGLVSVAEFVLWVVFQARASADAGGDLQAADFEAGLWLTLAGALTVCVAASVLPPAAGRRGAAGG